MSNPNLDAAPQELNFVKFSRVEQPKKIFFYQKKDDEGDVIIDSEIFACHEQEAGMFGKFHKLIGVGDGKTYYESLKNARVKETCQTCGGKKTVEQAILKDGKTEMQVIPCETCNGLGIFDRLLRPGMVIPVEEGKRVLREAFEAELTVARGKKAKPVYQNVSFDDTVLRHKNAKNIMESFNPPD